MAQRTVTIASSVGLHARPAALFVQAASDSGLDVEIGRPGEDAVDATSILGVMALGAKFGEEVVLTADGDGADDALDSPRRAPLPRPRRGVSTVAETETRQGIGVSPGSAYGPVVQVAPPVRPPADEPAVEDREAALADVRAAFESVAAGAGGQGPPRRRHGPADPQGHGPHRPGQGSGQGRRQAARRRAGPGDRHRERGRGVLRPVRGARRLLRRAGHRPARRRLARRRRRARRAGARACPDFTEPSVVVAEDLAPAETATLDRSLVVGIVTQAGGRTSHTAILAAQMGIPAVVQLARCHRHPRRHAGGARRRHRRGHHRARPRARRGAAGAPREARRGARRRQRAGRHPRRPPRRAARQHRRRGGRRVRRCAGPRGRRAVPHRVRLPLGRPRADRRGAGGDLPPGVPPFGDRRVVVRTLDAGADKPLAFADLGPEENPALGRRGLRLSAERPELLDAQLEALAIAAKDTGADVRVMAPMVATVEEAAWFARRVRENGLPKAGRHDRGAGGRAARRARARRGRLRQPRHQRPRAVHDGRRPHAGRAVRPARPVAAGRARRRRRRLRGRPAHRAPDRGVR